MPVIKVERLTKDYGHQRGVFDVSIEVQKGEVYGFLGPNGAGKTTAIRHIMGFSRPQLGRTFVHGLNSWEHASEIQKNLGYLPGEITLPDHLTGQEFINMMAKLRKIEDMSHTTYLLEKFDFDPSGNLKRMSLGMKRKLAIVTAFMHDPAVLVLDEPTSGLDPMMQKVFIDFILEEKKRGKTVLLSSHIFTEIDATCDRISIIKDGKIISTFIADELRHREEKTFKFEFFTKEEYEHFIEEVSSHEKLKIVDRKKHQYQIVLHIHDDSINDYVDLISRYKLKYFTELKYTLEDHFMEFYDRDYGSVTNGDD